MEHRHNAQSSMRDEALRLYDEFGWFVFPADPEEKKPYYGFTYKDRYGNTRPTREEVAGWDEWDKPGVRLGIRTGAVSDIVVLDGDTPEAYEYLRSKGIPPTPIVQSPRDGGGVHYYLKHPGRRVKSTAALGGVKGLDIRGDGGIVIAPPSPGSNGKVYEWIIPPEDADTAPLPEWVFELLDSEDRQHANSKAAPVGERIPKGRRNDTLASIAGTMRRRGMGEEEIFAALMVANERRCEPPLPESEVRKIAASIASYEPSEGKIIHLKGFGRGDQGGGEQEPLTPAFVCTDTGNSRRFAAKFKGRVIYSRAVGGYAVWDEKRFVRDEERQVVEMAKSLAQDLMKEAAKAIDEGDTERAKPLSKWSIVSCSAPRINAALDLARSEPGIAVHPDTLDTHKHYLNAENGTLDLETMTLLQHDPRHLLTKLAPVVYDPTATAPTWDAFMEQILPSEPLRKFVQKIVGICLSSSQDEQILPILYGRGANGKSTFVNAILELLGDYAQQAAPELLLAKKPSHPTEIAELKGRRFVPSVEVDDGRRLAEAFIKQLTGGERLRGRFMHQDFFEFDPEHHVILITNHKPIVRGTDYATWRRLKLVPFTVTIPKEKQDKQLLRKFRAERPGILNWALEGYQLWREEGLDEPEEVRKATSDYRAEQDVLGAFISECCIVNDKASVKFKTLYGVYELWCTQSGETRLNKRQFGTQLDERGFEGFNGAKNVAMRRRLGIRDDAPDPDNKGQAKIAFGGDEVNHGAGNTDSNRPKNTQRAEGVNHRSLTQEAGVNHSLTQGNSCKSNDFRGRVNEGYPKNQEKDLTDSHEEKSRKLINPINPLTHEAGDEDDKRPLSADLEPGQAATLEELRERREKKAQRRLTQEEAIEAQKLIDQGMDAKIARAAVLSEDAGLFEDEDEISF